jgi:endonuclease YncB( thermonuclease family)
MSTYRTNVSILLWLIFACSASAISLTGRVVKIADGDTLTVLDAGHTQHKIRLLGIDAPESGQPYGTVSRQDLGDLVFGKPVTVDYDKLDRYGRIVGKVLVNGQDANLEQIAAGLAWHYKYYQAEQSPTDRAAYAPAEIDARKAGKGLWADAYPVPSWDLRRGLREVKAGMIDSPSDKACGARRTCGQFASCAEALAYVRQCGSAGLDGDEDGVPCESLCR